MITKRFVLYVWAFACGITSSFFMLLVFLKEGFYDSGVLFIEPNIWIARFEFFAVLLGFVVQIILMITWLGPPKQTDEEPAGYEHKGKKFDGVYA